MICTDCGKNIPDGSNHCPFCGSCILGKDYQEEKRSYVKSYRKYNRDENSGYVRSYKNYNKSIGNRYSKNGSTESLENRVDYERGLNNYYNSIDKKNDVNNVFDLNSYSNSKDVTPIKNNSFNNNSYNNQSSSNYSNYSKAKSTTNKENIKAFKTFLIVFGIVIALIVIIANSINSGNDNTLTYENYSEITIGMSINTVIDIIGEPSSKTKIYQKEGSFTHYIDTYEWREGNAYIKVRFKNGYVESKDARDLYQG